MGENQGMVWIILAVVIVVIVVAALGTTMKGKVSDTTDSVSKYANSQVA